MQSNDFRLIPLSGKRGRGHSAIVDASDYPFLNQWSWHRAVDGYAAANITFAPRDKRKVPMHRLILGSPVGRLVTDHINRDRLDNRRSNLRIVDWATNCLNTSRTVRDENGERARIYVWVTRYGTWVAAYSVAPPRKLYAGSHKTKSEAIAAATRALDAATAS